MRHDSVVLLTASRLFTSVSPVLLQDQVLEIDEHGRIGSIRARSQIGASVELVDFGDGTLLPGLIDIHQHLCFDATLDPVPQLQADDDAALLLRMRHAAKRALSVGITTIRDLGDRHYSALALRDSIDTRRSGAAHLGSGPADHDAERALLVPGW